jgi:hypothetical protein
MPSYNDPVRAEAFYRAVTMDQADLLPEVLRRLEVGQVSYCVIGGQAVNAYVDPLVSLDLDVVIALEDVDRLLAALPRHVRIERFPHSINLSSQSSELRVQLQLDPRYTDFLSRASDREVLGTKMRVAAVDDVLLGKVWAATDPQRRASKRQKDLADIARLLEQFPDLRATVPKAVLDRLL